MNSFFDHYNIDLVKVISIVHDMPLKVIHGEVENIEFRMNNLRAAIFKMLCLEKIREGEAANKNDTSTTKLREKAFSVKTKLNLF